MSSLYGIESEDDCREKMDELLALCARAEEAKTKEAVQSLIARLGEYHKAGNANERERRMSEIERAYFWPAIAEAHAYRPNLNHRSKWSEGLAEVRWKLESNRPRK
jgi:chromatin segregation and condensation protein Rec8/ScpA/Scc1 (kleisin family)